MSRPRNYWYGIAKKMTSRYYKLDSSIEQERIFNDAVTATIKQTEQSGELAGDKLKAVKLVLFDQRYTIQGAALKLHYSEFAVQKWLNEFVNLVGVNAGYHDSEA